MRNSEHLELVATDVFVEDRQVQNYSLLGGVFLRYTEQTSLEADGHNRLDHLLEQKLLDIVLKERCQLLVNPVDFC